MRRARGQEPPVPDAELVCDAVDLERRRTLEHHHPLVVVLLVDLRLGEASAQDLLDGEARAARELGRVLTVGLRRITAASRPCDDTAATRSR